MERQAETMQKGQLSCNTPNSKDIKNTEKVPMMVVAAVSQIRLFASLEYVVFAVFVSVFAIVASGKTAKMATVLYANNPMAAKGISVKGTTA